MSSSDNWRTRAVRLARGRRRFSGSAFLRNRDGLAAIEFGIVFPLLCLIILGSIEFGRVFETRNQVSHALSRAVRVVNLDSNQTASQIATLMADYLEEFEGPDLSISTTNVIVSDVDYMDISVSFPFQVILPFSPVSEVTLNVDTRAPLISATQ